MKHFEFINYIRCFASLFVCGGHILTNMSASGFAANYGIQLIDIYNLNRISKYIIGFGSMVAVYLFFLASGFTMYVSISKYSKSQFLANRVFRIFPVLFASIIIYQIAAHIYQIGGAGLIRSEYLELKRVLIDLLLIRDLFPKKWSFLGVLWTLEIEWKFYIFIALTANYFRRRANIITFYCGIVSGLILLFYINAVQNLNCGKAEFPADMARWFVFEDPTYIYTITQLPVRFWYFGFMLIGSFFAMSVAGEISDKQLRRLVFINTVILLPGKSIVGSIVLFYLLFKFKERFCVSRIIRFFSDISYPLYLIHPVSYFVLSTLGQAKAAGPGLTFAVCMFFSIVTSWIIHHLVEKPFIKIGKKFSAKYLFVNCKNRVLVNVHSTSNQ